MRLARLLRPVPLFLACASVLCAAASDPQAAPQGLYDALLQAMKQGPSLGFSGRVKLIDPAVRSAMDLPFMARLTAGPAWQDFTPQQQADFVQVFSDYSVAVYASRFKSYSGERFVVDPKTTPRPNGDVIVHTQLIPGGGGDPVRLDYLERNIGGQWRIVDIFLGGTISQVATQYSEYSATIARGGAPALIDLLKQKTAQLK